MRLLPTTALLAVLATAFACGGSDSSPTSPSSTSNTTSPIAPAPGGSSTGRLSLMLKDSPFSDAKSLLVTFSEVSAHQTGGPFTVLPFADGGTTRTCDLKKLMDAQDVLGAGALATGHYTQIRLVVSSAVLYFDNESAGEPCAAEILAPEGTSAEVDIPSGEVKLNRQFEVTTDDVTTMLLDFDGDRSVRLTGNGRYLMTPVITIVSVGTAPAGGE